MSTKYSLNVKHNGTIYGDFCIYQTQEGEKDDIRSLVWFKKTAHPNTQLHFEWGIDYGISWSETGNLIPGVIFRASEDRMVDPSDAGNNTVGFAKNFDAFQFTPSNNPTVAGKVGIVCDGNIPADVAAIGLSMSGRAALARPAHPNLKYTFSPHPRYWIAFGNFEEGEVLDLNRMTEKFEIKFPVNQYERSIELTGNNTWKDIS